MQQQQQQPLLVQPVAYTSATQPVLPAYHNLHHQSQPPLALHQAYHFPAAQHQHQQHVLVSPQPHFNATQQQQLPQPHVNLTYTSLLEVPYERFAEGSGAPVLVSNGTSASYVAPQHLLKTQAFQVGLPVYSACPHYTQLGTCMLGASCGLVHTVQLVAPPPPLQQLLQPHQQPYTPFQASPYTAPPPIMYATAPNWPQPGLVSPMFGASTVYSTQSLFPSAITADAPLSHEDSLSTAPRILRFSNSRQRRGNKPITVPAAAVGDTQPGPRQLIVNYLAPRVDTAGLRQLFEAFGEVEDALVVSDSRTGASRGFGFVVYKLSADAATAIDAASGRVLLGKRVRIGYLNPQFPVDTSSRLSLSEIAATLEPLLNDDSDDTLEDSGEGAGGSASVTLTDDVSSDYFGFAAGRTSHQHSGSGAEM